MATIFTYSVCVDGYHFATDDRAAVAYLLKSAKSTMVVTEWNDERGQYVSVPQHDYMNWK